MGLHLLPTLLHRRLHGLRWHLTCDSKGRGLRLRQRPGECRLRGRGQTLHRLVRSEVHLLGELRDLLLFPHIDLVLPQALAKLDRVAAGNAHILEVGIFHEAERLHIVEAATHEDRGVLTQACVLQEGDHGMLAVQLLAPAAELPDPLHHPVGVVGRHTQFLEVAFLNRHQGVKIVETILEQREGIHREADLLHEGRDLVALVDLLARPCRALLRRPLRPGPWRPEGERSAGAGAADVDAQAPRSGS
mmetsp:Transcript_170579/g.547150  ORF Transcript_170579/g.547150 Transcript_170579/m.547150 type:complete len:247 (+) Transcript_170579:1124-1864(+)